MSKVNNDPMGERLKSYERVAENVLPSRLPVIIRFDGNSFSRLIFQELGFNFNDLPAHWKRGRCIVRKTYEVPVADLMPAPQFERLVASGKLQPGQTTMRSSWVVDRDIPRFNHDKGYIGRFLSDDPAPSREEVEVLAQ